MKVEIDARVAIGDVVIEELILIGCIQPNGGFVVFECVGQNLILRREVEANAIGVIRKDAAFDAVERRVIECDTYPVSINDAIFDLCVLHIGKVDGRLRGAANFHVANNECAGSSVNLDSIIIVPCIDDPVFDDIRIIEGATARAHAVFNGEFVIIGNNDGIVEDSISRDCDCATKDKQKRGAHNQPCTLFHKVSLLWRKSQRVS